MCPQGLLAHSAVLNVFKDEPGRMSFVRLEEHFKRYATVWYDKSIDNDRLFMVDLSDLYDVVVCTCLQKLFGP